MPTVKQLRHFCAVMDCGSIQRAADSAHISQPALTRSIGKQESELGLPLFERSKAGMAPLEFAAEIAPRFRDVLLALEDIERDARLYRNADSGVLCIGFGQAVREPLLRECLPRFVEAYPGVAVRIREGTSNELISALQDRKVDMVFAGVGSFHEHEFLSSEVIRRLAMSVVVRAAHPLAGQRSITLPDLLRYPRVVPTSLGDRHPFLNTLDTANVDLAEPHVTCSDYEVLKKVVETTDAWSISLDQLSQRGCPKQLVKLDVKGFDLEIELGILELKERTRSPSANRFIDLVKSVVTTTEATVVDS